MKIISATAVAAALLATVAVARTVQTHVTAVQATSGQAIAAIPHSAPFVRHDNFACALPNEAECEKIETLLPKRVFGARNKGEIRQRSKTHTSAAAAPCCRGCARIALLST